MDSMRSIWTLVLCVAAFAVSAGADAQARKRGDMDEDGRQSVRDVTLMTNYVRAVEAGILGAVNDLETRGLADVDCNGMASRADISALVDIILCKHEAVDLGLSVRWATMNIGATGILDSGDFFAWGEVAPKDTYTEANYAYCTGNVFNSIGSNIAGTRYDAAHILWGDTWRLPTLIDINELKNKCTWELVTILGETAWRVTGPNGNSILLPMAGYRRDDAAEQAGTACYYWCSMKPSTASAAYCLYSQNYTGNWSANRSYGFPIRPVCK